MGKDSLFREQLAWPVVERTAFVCQKTGLIGKVAPQGLALSINITQRMQLRLAYWQQQLPKVSVMLKRTFSTLAYKLPNIRGKNRLMRKLIRLTALGESIIIHRKGVNYEVVGEDLIDYLIMSSDYESPLLVKGLSRHIGSTSMCLWDIGANVGAVSLPLLRECPNLKVVMFEPSPSVCGRLLRNLACNPDLVSRAWVMPIALSDRTEWKQFYVSSESFNSGVGGLYGSANRERFGPLVRAHRGDELTDIVPLPDAIKIDVEGFELEVLNGLGSILDRDLAIVFEHCVYRLQERRMSNDAVVNFVRGRGYSLASLRQVNVDLDKDDDIIATRKLV